jgi:hypothetical protein
MREQKHTMPEIVNALSVSRVTLCPHTSRSATTASKRRRTARSRSRPLDARSMSRPADAKTFTKANGLALFSAPLPPQGLLVRPGILGHAATRRLG